MGEKGSGGDVEGEYGWEQREWNGRLGDRRDGRAKERRERSEKRGRDRRKDKE